MKSRAALAVASLVLLLVSAGGVRAEDSPKSIFQKTLRSTCMVIVPNVGSGSGWLVDKDKKLIVTNHHVVLNADRVTVLFPLFKDGKLVSEKSAYHEERGVRAKVIDTDVPRDLAVLQLIDALPEGVASLPLARDSAEPSDRVHSVGNPGASDALWVYTSGTVRAVYKKEWHHLDLDRKTKTFRKAAVLETTSPVNPGDSGGPVVNDLSELVAVVSSGRTKDASGPVQLMTWHIDVNEVKAFLEQTRRLLDPKTAADFVLRGERNTERNKFADAISDFTAALKLDRNHAAAYRKRGWAFGCQGDYDTTIADCNEAIRLDPDDAFSYENRGWAYEKKKDPEKAIQDYTRAIQLDTKFARAYNNRGVIYFHRKEYSRAEKDFTRAIEADPKFAVAWGNRGDSYLQMGDYDKALVDCTSALRLNPYLTYVWNRRGWALREKKMQDQHVANFEEALEYDPKNASLWVSYGNALTFKDQWAKAVNCYTKALEFDKNSGDAYYFRGSALEELGRIFDAQPDYEKSIQIDASWKNKVKTHQRAYLQVKNDTDAPIQVYMMYEYMTEEGKWTWHPTPENSVKSFWKIEPGKTIILLDEGWKVECRRVRIWATAPTANLEWTGNKNKDLWLVPKDGYLAKKRYTFTQTFQK